MDQIQNKEIIISSDGATITTEKNLSHNPFLSPTSHEQFDNSTDFTTAFYPSLFSVSSPSDCSFDDDVSNTISTENRLNQASFILEYQQLYNSYTVCLTKLQDSVKEVDALRQQNDTLRLANTDLVQQLSLLSQATMQNCLISSVQRPSQSLMEDFNRLSVDEHNRLDRRNRERDSMPKSISVRSKGYLKSTHRDGSSNVVSNNAPSRQRVLSGLLGGSQRVYVPGRKKTEEALEFEVYNQGMSKTELCNKWQETGTCPYGENCHFAHGISELRPVIRHPSYKTQVCRMVLVGDSCPYGHRCHFRHSITDQDGLQAVDPR